MTLHTCVHRLWTEVAPFWRHFGPYAGPVSTIQVKHVPEDVHATLRARAAAKGMSLQEYLLAHLTDEARTPSLDEVLARPRTGGRVSMAAAVTAVRAERDGR